MLISFLSKMVAVDASCGKLADFLERLSPTVDFYSIVSSSSSLRHCLPLRVTVILFIIILFLLDDQSEIIRWQIKSSYIRPSILH